MSVVATRLKFGSIAIALVVGVFWLDKSVLPLWTSGVVLSLFALGAQAEFYGMLKSSAKESSQAPLMKLGLLGGALYLMCRFAPACCGTWDATSCLAAVLVGLLVLGVLGGKPAGAPSRIGGTMFGIILVPVLIGYGIEIRGLPDGWAWLVFLIAVAKAGDSAAFFAGRFLGKHKLAPNVSPNKTWEGAFGSILGSMLAAWIVAQTAFDVSPEPMTWILGALVVNLGAQFGDLSESLLKRGCEVKDSATFIPVMGGAFDMVDSFLIAAPALRVYLAFYSG
ncbi:MAG: phosphatidate cytidylyltransferase [Planctomycetota bacterium]|jgi:phosphatidate cytidylyltransferase|nr:phosphatidate cytidylyltransferase [Planctomycetota bacterium]MDP6942371.1 phosphatidate cytidylyltransferase [Planctomycetota bacterium]